MERKKFVFAQRIEKGELQQDGNLVRLPLSTILTEGEHNGILFLREEIEKARFPDVFPLTLNHSRDVEDEVGWWESPRVENGKLRAVPVINLETAKGPAALGYIKNRLQAGLVPEVSVEVWVTIDQDEQGRKIARELEIDKASLVDRGACGPDKGCGVGLQKEEKEEVDLGVVPRHPWRYGKDAEADWSKPNLSDFTDKSWGELSDSEKRDIAGHYAWAPENPPERFTDLKLPHHRPKDHAVVWNGVRAAMAALLGARGGVDIPAGDKRAVYNHLAAHYKEFDKVPPQVTFSDDGEIIEVMWMEEEDKLEFGAQPEPAEAEQVEQEAEAQEQAEKEPTMMSVDEVKKLLAEKDEEIAKLAAELEELEKAKAELEAKVKEYEEREREAIVTELRKYNPNFDGEGKSLVELRELLEFVRNIKVPLSGRKSLVVSPDNEPADPAKMYEAILKKKIKEIRGD